MLLIINANLLLITEGIIRQLDSLSETLRNKMSGGGLDVEYAGERYFVRYRIIRDSRVPAKHGSKVVTKKLKK